MNSNFSRCFALACLAGLAACSGAAPSPQLAGPQVAPGAVRAGGTLMRFGGPSSRVQSSPGWVSPDVRRRKKSLLYASSYDGGYINIYPEHGSNQQPIGKLTTDLVSPQGMTVDARDRLWVANTNAFNVVAFKRGATTPFTTLSDPDYFPIEVAINSQGTVYASNAESTTGPPGNVTYWTKGSTSPSGTLTYSGFNIVLGVGVDASNNVYVSYIPKSGPPAMVEFPAGSTTGKPLAIQDANVGEMSFDKSGNMLMETLSNNLGVWAPPYTSGPARTIAAFGNEPTLDKRQHYVWIAYANFSNPMVEGYDYTTGTQTDVITNGWVDNSAVPYGVALIRLSSAFAAAALLSACASDAGASLTPAHTGTRPAWYRAAPATIKKGVYVAEYYTNDVLGYQWKTGSNPPPICSLPAAYVVDVATDAAGNLIDPDGGSRTVSVFRGPAMCGAKLGSFADTAGQPADAATQDAVTDTIYVANLQATGQPYGNVSVCTLESGCGAVLSNRAIGGQLFSVAEDAHGNVYASGYANPSVSGYGGGSALILWKRGAGKGAKIAAYRNKTPGGLEIDKHGDLLALDTFARSLWIYTGCPRSCSAHGPFALNGRSVYGKLDARNDVFEAADFEYGQVDVYRYAGTSGITYLYSFNDGMTPSGDVEGIAIDPG